MRSLRSISSPLTHYSMHRPRRESLVNQRAEAVQYRTVSPSLIV